MRGTNLLRGGFDYLYAHLRGDDWCSKSNHSHAMGGCGRHLRLQLRLWLWLDWSVLALRTRSKCKDILPGNEDKGSYYPVDCTTKASP